MGTVHNSVHGVELEQRFDAFVPIPEKRKLSNQDNSLLMQVITTDEFIRAIAALNRHRAAGPDGLNNDFFNDTQAVLVPALVEISNELLRGGNPSASFLEALVTPLKQKGNSVDAMNFRPISLLQTGYEIYMKVIAKSSARHGDHDSRLPTRIHPRQTTNEDSDHNASYASHSASPTGPSCGAQPSHPVAGL
jgi:hypothetical protein